MDEGCIMVSTDQQQRAGVRLECAGQSPVDQLRWAYPPAPGRRGKQISEQRAWREPSLTAMECEPVGKEGAQSAVCFGGLSRGSLGGTG